MCWNEPGLISMAFKMIKSIRWLLIVTLLKRKWFLQSVNRCKSSHPLSQGRSDVERGLGELASSSSCQQLGLAASVCSLLLLRHQISARLARVGIDMSNSTSNAVTWLHFFVFKTKRIERRMKIREEQRKGGQEKKGNRNKKRPSSPRCYGFAFNSPFSPYMLQLNPFCFYFNRYY